MESVILFDIVLPYLKIFIELIGVIIIAMGALHAVYSLLLGVMKQQLDTNYVRFHFGNSVILGLEFMVGADIIGSLVRPNYYNVGILAIVVLIRTILSYFLNLELQHLTPEQKKNLS